MSSKYKFPRRPWLTFVPPAVYNHFLNLSWTSDHLWTMVRTYAHLRINYVWAVKSCVVWDISRHFGIYHYGLRRSFCGFFLALSIDLIEPVIYHLKVIYETCYSVLISLSPLCTEISVFSKLTTPSPRALHIEWNLWWMNKSF